MNQSGSHLVMDPTSLNNLSCTYAIGICIKEEGTVFKISYKEEELTGVCGVVAPRANKRLMWGRMGDT